MSGSETCPSCGEWIGAGTTWCLHCGAAVASTADEEDGDSGTDAAGDGRADPDDGGGTVAVEANEEADLDANEETRGEANEAADLDDDSEGDEGSRPRTRDFDDEGPSVSRLEVALHFVNRYEWLRGVFGLAVLAAMLAAVFQFRGPGWRSVVVVPLTLLLWLYAISQAGTKRILVEGARATAALLVVSRASGVVPNPLASDPARAAELAFDGPTLVVVAALLVGAQLLSTLVVQPRDPYGVSGDPD